MTEPKPMITVMPRGDSIPMEELVIPRLSNMVKGEGSTFLNYGPAGSGKTFFAGSAGERTLHINNGAGVDTLLSPLFQSKYQIDPIIETVAEKMSTRGVFDTALVFDEICDKIDYYILNHRDKIDTIVVDDVTQLRKGAMNKALELNQAQNKSQTLSQVVRKFDIVSAAVQDYQAEMNLIEQFIASYTTICKNAGLNFIMNAHERMVFGKANKIGEPRPLLKIMPGFTGETFPDQVTGYFDNVWHFEVVGGGSNRVYRVVTQGHEALIAKTRWGGVFETVETNLNFESVMRRIRETTPETMKKRR